MSLVRFGRVLLVSSLLGAPFLFVAHAVHGSAERVSHAVAQTLLRVTASLAPQPVAAPREPAASLSPDNWAQPVVLSRPLRGRPGASPRRPSAPTGLFVSKETVLRLAQSAARPQGAFVGPSAEHPAGLQLSGVNGLGIGVQDGDILIEALGMTPRAPGQVIGAILEARARQERWLSGTLWRAGQTLRITVEQPYLPGKREASETAHEAASPGDATAHASAQAG